MCDNKIWFMDDQHLKSFWSYHQAALQWMKTHEAAREYAMNNSSDTIASSVETKSSVMNNHLPTQTSSNNCFLDVRQESPPKNVDEDDEDYEMSSEMIAFFQQTIEHRKQRDAERNKETKRSKKDGCLKEDNYVMADKIGVYGSEKRSFQLPNEPAERRKKFDKMKELYGTEAEKILAMEAHLDLRFEQNYCHPGAHLWPNIPLKL